jgi:hypothetical protein
MRLMKMKSSLLVLCALLLPAHAAAAGQQEILKEKVSVVNVEVPVRVFLDGAPLTGLSKGEFRLSEGGAEQDINGFIVRRKKISVENIALRPDAGAPPARYFVLVFRIIEYNDQMRDGVRYIFEHLLRQQDKQLVMVNERTLLMTPDLELEKRREILDQMLAEEAVRAQQRLEQYFLSVQRDLDQTRLRTLLERDSSFYAPRITEFLTRYLDTWNEFKEKYLVPDLDKFYHFARHLEQVREEKWVLSFFQIEMFPHMKISGQIRQEIEALISSLLTDRPEDALHARIMEGLLARIDRELNAADTFPSEEIGKMLVKVDTTYHSFIMGVQREAFSGDLEFKKVASDIENSLREITRRSGGEVYFSGDIGSSLRAVEEREDVYYVLTYEPRDPERRGKVKVQLDGHPGAKLVYDDNIRVDYIEEYLKKKRAEDPEILLHGLNLDDRQLRLKISNCKMVAVRKGREGQVNVTIRIRDEQNREIYNQSRLLAVKEPLVELSVDFHFLRPGRFMFLVEARDQLTGKTAMDLLQSDVR